MSPRRPLLGMDNPTTRCPLSSQETPSQEQQSKLPGHCKLGKALTRDSLSSGLHSASERAGNRSISMINR
uniref:Uncharacterized protein n=1 Tax=Helianthus annuus TaxID=4232 RepID=A0A251U0U6_HELAN